MKLDDVTKLNVHKCLYHLTFMKEKTQLEARNIKNKFK